MAQDLLTRASHVERRPILHVGQYVGASIVGLVIVIIAAVVVAHIGSDTGVASVSPPAVQAQDNSAVASAIGVPGLTPAQVADAAGKRQVQPATVQQ